VIRGSTRDLLDAIDDVDTAARIEQHALVLRPGRVAVADLLSRAATDLEPLMRLRGAIVEIDSGDEELGVVADEIAVARIVNRLLGLVIGASTPGERFLVRASRDADMIALTFDQPRSFAGHDGEELFARHGDSDDGPSLLGVGFTLRLARNLAGELGGGLTIGEDRLTLRLPAALDHDVGQLSSN
jgi:hypothetical protein